MAPHGFISSFPLILTQDLCGLDSVECREAPSLVIDSQGSQHWHTVLLRNFFSSNTYIIKWRSFVEGQWKVQDKVFVRLMF